MVVSSIPCELFVIPGQLGDVLRAASLLTHQFIKFMTFDNNPNSQFQVLTEALGSYGSHARLSSNSINNHNL